MYSTPPQLRYPQLRYPQLRYFRSYAILNWVQKELELSYFLLFSPQFRYFLLFPPHLRYPLCFRGKNSVTGEKNAKIA